MESDAAQQARDGAPHPTVALVTGGDIDLVGRRGKAQQTCKGRKTRRFIDDEVTTFRQQVQVEQGFNRSFSTIRALGISVNRPPRIRIPMRSSDDARIVALEHFLDFAVVGRKKYLQLPLPFQERVKLSNDRQDSNPIIGEAYVYADNPWSEMAAFELIDSLANLWMQCEILAEEHRQNGPIGHFGQVLKRALKMGPETLH